METDRMVEGKETITEDAAMQAIVQTTQIQEDGTVTVRVKDGLGGMKVQVIVVFPDADDPAEDLLQASVSSADFWDNPIDDETWNQA